MLVFEGIASLYTTADDFSRYSGHYRVAKSSRSYNVRLNDFVVPLHSPFTASG